MFHFTILFHRFVKHLIIKYTLIYQGLNDRKHLPHVFGYFFKEYMAEAVAYIEEHLQEEDLSIIATAAHVYLNPVYFGRIFKSTFHMTFKQYLVKKRMDKAKRMLEEGDTSIRTICEEVGISNPSYFSQLFKQYTGKLPSEYKKEYEV